MQEYDVNTIIKALTAIFDGNQHPTQDRRAFNAALGDLLTKYKREYNIIKHAEECNINIVLMKAKDSSIMEKNTAIQNATKSLMDNIAINENAADFAVYCFARAIGYPLSRAESHTMRAQEDRELFGSALPLQERAELCDRDAQCDFGCALNDGDGIDKNADSAIYWWKLAADQEQPEAQYDLGQAYYWGWGTEGKDVERAIYWYRKASKNEHSRASFSIGNIYYYGDGVEKNLEETISWWTKAAELGEIDAQNNLALLYLWGEGFVKDFKMANHWWRKAAESGDADAQFNLGQSYNNGEGVDYDLEQAVYWWREAAKQGMERANNKLIEMGFEV